MESNQSIMSPTLTGIVAEIKTVLESARGNVARQVNSELLSAYWNIGRIISEYEQTVPERADYGKQTLKELAKVLTAEFGKGFSRSNLQNMRTFYLTYEKCQTLSGKLSWSHYCELLSVSDPDKRSFYEKEAVNSNWSVRELKRQIDSSLFERLLLSRRFPFENGAVLGAVGGVNMGNGLYAIQKLVFEEKKYTMARLLEALDADWVGFEEMRREFQTQPKYGNGIREVDETVAEVYRRFAEACLSLPCVYGDTLKPNAISISAHQPGGALTGATPDGRKGGEILADASLSPDHGQDVSGPLAVFRSAMTVDQDAYQGTLMNMKFLPSALSSREDLEKLSSVVKTYLTHGGKHIQFNVVDRAQLEDAKAHPEKHGDLVVRVAGYSAYFTRLPASIQDEVIDRSEQRI